MIIYKSNNPKKKKTSYRVIQYIKLIWGQTSSKLTQRNSVPSGFRGGLSSKCYQCWKRLKGLILWLRVGCYNRRVSYFLTHISSPWGSAPSSQSAFNTEAKWRTSWPVPRLGPTARPECKREGKKRRDGESVRQGSESYGSNQKQMFKHMWFSISILSRDWRLCGWS